MKKIPKLTLLASIAMVGFTSQSHAALLIHDSFITGSNQVGSVDYFSFTTTDTGNVRIETFTDNFDSFLYLFRDDGNLSSDDFIALDDDSGSRNTGKNPLGFSNSLLNLSLEAGSYITAVGDFFLSEIEAINGVNDSSAFGVGSGQYRLEVEGNFLLSQAPVIPIDPTNPGNNPQPPTNPVNPGNPGNPNINVTEPVSLGLFGLALAGFGAIRRRKS